MASNSDRAANSFMPLYGGDYLRDTMHLSCAEHGIYLRLLIHYWHAQAPLPSDQRKLEGIAGVRDEGDKSALTSVIQQFFKKHRGGGNLLHNKRMDREIAKADELKEKFRQAGHEGGLKSAKARSSHPQATLNQSTANTTTTATTTSRTTATKAKARSTPSGDASRAGPENGSGRTSETEAAYRQAIEQRYGKDPGALNAKQRGMLARLLERVPISEGPAIARFYVVSDRRLYINATHCIDLLLRDCEALRLAMLAGRQVGGPQSEQERIEEHNRIAAERWLEEQKAKDDTGRSS